MTDITDLTDLHDDLRTAARKLLTRTPDWAALTRAGWPGLEIPDEFGGAGATFAETAVLLTEIGRAAAPTPYPSVALGVAALGLLEPSPTRDRLLSATAAGEARPILVLDGSTPNPAPHEDTEWVLDATAATSLLVPVVDADRTTALAVVSPDAPGVTVRPRPLVDETRMVGAVAVERASAEAILRFTDPRNALRHLADRASIAVACDSLGIAEAMLAATVDYVKVREQFGRPIGSFQAVQHACADMLVDLTIARQLVTAAVRADTDPGTAAAMAKSFTTAAAVRVTGKAVQLHGGIGYTWESGLHRYLKRATLNRALFGAPADHRKRLAARYADRFTPAAAAPPAPADPMS
ncbi:acyl-CoA dehydrogenase family protein [Nocardia sp. NPDC004068]|uniref:acyl-CoA dehydrogenase family protein n=1 Tax=Nocardia sp. NPDC004068 TaxID=3364303 RepID=UPI00369511DC